MPLFQTANFPATQETANGAAGSWALWRLDEPEEELLARLDTTIFDTAELQQIRVEQRRKEWLGCRLALQTLLAAYPVATDLSTRQAGSSLRMHKNELGRPYLLGRELHISLSHAYPYAGAALHPRLSVGLDVEQVREQLLRIRHKFLSAHEQALLGDNLEQLCLWWAAKEALYKLNGQPGLIFARDMLVAPSDRPGQLQGWLKGQPYALHYQWHGPLLLCVVA
ncbi:4'-phosphopantetheinyl transferase family protein [Cesiribacter andamanensis]|uniref:4'-phosphopantetheinyl transferase superfamily protein n=1 Tax=Cesiribacter andamanensis AMV16 TaxID=1279009 RepID=M7N085_9BACT|nr:4'-phosphopantetheinyl transferase superfamily protein [Cesiribacter andamanensis]EMR02108.1 4'-phosphopantetheinyl transferase superfamily protein [Cesiribacter andamanensis AMV16]